MSDHRYRVGIPAAAILSLAAFGTSYGVDPPAQAPAAPQAPMESSSKPASGDGHMMMDHSPADTKSMSKMKDKKIPIHHPGDPVPKSDVADKPVDHMMMDHSPADTKSMSKMKEKKIPTHHSGSEQTKDDGGLPKN